MCHNIKKFNLITILFIKAAIIELKSLEKVFNCEEGDNLHLTQNFTLTDVPLPECYLNSKENCSSVYSPETKRFNISREKENVNISISNLNTSDSGSYKCQTIMESYCFKLIVEGKPKLIINGDGQLKEYITFDANRTVNISCQREGSDNSSLILSMNQVPLSGKVQRENGSVSFITKITTTVSYTFNSSDHNKSLICSSNASKFQTNVTIYIKGSSSNLAKHIAKTCVLAEFTPKTFHFTTLFAPFRKKNVNLTICINNTKVKEYSLLINGEIISTNGSLKSENQLNCSLSIEDYLKDVTPQLTQLYCKTSVLINASYCREFQIVNETIINNTDTIYLLRNNASLSSEDCHIRYYYKRGNDESTESTSASFVVTLILIIVALLVLTLVPAIFKILQGRKKKKTDQPENDPDEQRNDSNLLNGRCNRRIGDPDIISSNYQECNKSEIVLNVSDESSSPSEKPLTPPIQQERSSEPGVIYAELDMINIPTIKHIIKPVITMMQAEYAVISFANKSYAMNNVPTSPKLTAYISSDMIPASHYDKPPTIPSKMIPQNISNN